MVVSCFYKIGRQRRYGVASRLLPKLSRLRLEIRFRSCESYVYRPEKRQVRRYVLWALALSCITSFLLRSFIFHNPTLLCFSPKTVVASTMTVPLLLSKSLTPTLYAVLLRADSQKLIEKVKGCLLCVRRYPGVTKSPMCIRSCGADFRLQYINLLSCHYLAPITRHCCFILPKSSARLSMTCLPAACPKRRLRAPMSSPRGLFLKGLPKSPRSR
jgi:hypothetical protein